MVIIFSKFTKGLDKPFDNIFSKAMVETSKDLFGRFNAYCSHTQSDEITLYVPAIENIDGNSTCVHQFSGRTQKLASLVAGFTTVSFNKNLRYFVYEHIHSLKENCNRDYEVKLLEKLDSAYFDARVLGVPSREEAFNVFMWRNRDCLKNSKAQFAQAYCSHKELVGKSLEEQIQYCLEKTSKGWNKLEDKFKYGILIKKEIYQKKIESTTGACTRSRLVELSRQFTGFSEENVELITSKYYNENSRF